MPNNQTISDETRVRDHLRKVLAKLVALQKQQPTDAEMKAKAIAPWNNEGGAPEAGDVSVRKRPKRPRDPNQMAKSQREDKPSKVTKGSK